VRDRISHIFLCGVVEHDRMVGVLFDHLVIGRLVERLACLRVNDVAVGAPHVALAIFGIEVIRRHAVPGSEAIAARKAVNERA
jgi:hypothetical protein